MRIKKHRRSIYLNPQDEHLLMRMYIDGFKSTNDKASISDIIAKGIRLLAREEKLECFIEVK